MCGRLASPFRTRMLVRRSASRLAGCHRGDHSVPHAARAASAGPVRGAQPRRLGAVWPRPTALPLDATDAGEAARARRSHVADATSRGLPAAHRAAQPVRPDHRRAAPLDERVPRTSHRSHPVRHRHRRLGGRRQVDHRPPAARAARRGSAPWRTAARGSSSSRPTASCSRTPSSTDAVSCSARAFRSRTIGARCCGSSTDVKSGADEVIAPVYCHLVLRHRARARQLVRRPDILIVEGLNVLQPAAGPSRRPSRPRRQRLLRLLESTSTPTPRHPRLVRRRFLSLRETAFADPRSYFHRYAELSDEEAVAPRRADLGTPSTGPTCDRTSCRPAAGPPPSCARARDHRVEWIRIRKAVASSTSTRPASGGPRQWSRRDA